MIYLTPTSASRLSRVKRFSADLTDDVIRAGSFAPVDLVRDMKPHLSSGGAGHASSELLSEAMRRQASHM